METEKPKKTVSKSLTFARRTLSTLLLWAIVAAIFSSSLSPAYLAMIGVLVLISTKEYFKMLRAAEVKCFPRFGFLLAVLYIAASSYYFMKGDGDIPPVVDAVFIFVALTGAFTLQLRYAIKGIEALLAVAVNLLGFLYIAYLFTFASRLSFALPGEGAVPGSFVLLWLLAVTKFTDMGAYITGSLIGKHKMIPHISPGKTWEGFAGAILFAQLAACGLYALVPGKLSALSSWEHVIALGFLLAILAVIGDLAESVVKRSLHAKDSGNMLPGIGGGLDLIDSICFTAPALYFYHALFLA
ncbi:phosphatidate cytidylyltransferase [Luteolibacter sp. AS25]|uniref:phosphatidate cytidylyltransferase n=1 Tax=Luteolibacter sp. AS25 TaxID=3135776 RepID=UPI00398AB8AF